MARTAMFSCINSNKKQHVEKKVFFMPLQINNAAAAGFVMDWAAMASSNISVASLTDDKAHLLAGVMEQTYEMAEECIKTNFYSTKRVTEALIPLVRQSQSSRIVNVSSLYGLLQFINNEKVKEELKNTESLTVEKLDDIVEWYLRDFREGNLKENGWPLVATAYKASKAFINAYTRLIAEEFSNFRVNCVHLWVVKTDLTNHNGNMIPEEGARAPVMLALLPDSSPSGLFFNEMEPSSF